MPITIGTPTTDQPFGPGFFTSWFTTFVGPLAPGSFWQISLYSLVSEDRLARKVIPYTDPTEETIMTASFLDLTAPVPGKFGWSTGDAGQLEVLLVEPGFGTAETQTVNVVLDRQSGQVAELAQWIQGQFAAQPVGLTTDQGEQLNRVEASIGANSPFGPLELIPGLSAALNSTPPLGWTSLSGPYTLTGDGEMPDIGDVLHTKVGIYWTASVPAGLGRLHGVTDEYQIRLVQFRTVHQVGGQLMVTELSDLDWEGGLWMWANGKPVRIDYSVSPGVVVTARWVQFP